MTNCDYYKALESLINSIKEACPDFAIAYQYLRKRRNCPGAKAFDIGRKKIDDALKDAIIAYKGGKDE